jgi:hypothetical protein
MNIEFDIAGDFCKAVASRWSRQPGLVGRVEYHCRDICFTNFNYLLTFQTVVVATCATWFEIKSHCISPPKFIYFVWFTNKQQLCPERYYSFGPCNGDAEFWLCGVYDGAIELRSSEDYGRSRLQKANSLFCFVSPYQVILLLVRPFTHMSASWALHIVHT